MLSSCKDTWIIFMVHLVWIYLTYHTYKIMNLRFLFTTTSNIYILVWSHHKSTLKSYYNILALLNEALLSLTQQHIKKNHVQRYKKNHKKNCLVPKYILNRAMWYIKKKLFSCHQYPKHIPKNYLEIQIYHSRYCTNFFIFCLSFFLLVYAPRMIFILGKF